MRRDIIAPPSDFEDDDTMPTGDEGALDRASRVNFRVGDLVDTLSDHPGSPSIVAKTLVGRYVDFVADGLRHVRETLNLTEAEALVLCDALHGLPVAPSIVPLVPEAVRQAAVVRHAGRALGVDGEALAARVGEITIAPTAALLDAVERFWHLEDRMPDPGERLRHVGLINGD